MKPKTTLFFGCVAGMLALQLSIADDQQDKSLERTIDNLTEENTSLIQKLKQHDEFSTERREEAILKTAEKMESDLRAAIEQYYHEEMDVHVEMEEVVAGEFRANVGIATSLEPTRYGGLVSLAESTITMDDVQVLIVKK